MDSGPPQLFVMSDTHLLWPETFTLAFVAISSTPLALAYFDKQCVQKESNSAWVEGIRACSSILSVSNLLFPNGQKASLCARALPERLATKAGALREVVWSPLNSFQKFHFVFTSSGLVKSGALKALLALLWSAVYLCINVKADLKRKKE